MLIFELYALLLKFDVVVTIKFILNQISSDTFQRKISLFMCINSKFLYDCFVKLGTTQKKRLIINILYLK